MTEGPPPSPSTLVAHRGDTSGHPENTLAALEAARTAGARWFEVDVRFSRDGVPVLLHDPGLDRLAGCDREVADLDLEDLERLRLREPARLGARHPGEPIARLSRLADWLQPHPGLTVFVECKPEPVTRLGVGRVREALLRALAPVCARVVLISFDAGLIRALSAGDLAGLGWILRAWDASTRALATELAPDYLFVNRGRVPEGEDLWPGPWRWVAYEAGDDPGLARALLGRGFDLVETMHFARLAAALARQPRR